MVEYVLFVTAVVIVCIYFLTSGPMANSLNTSLNGIIGQLNNINSQINLTP